MDRNRRRTVRWTAVASLSLMLGAAASVWPSIATAAADTTAPTVFSPVVRFRPLVSFVENAWVSITIVGRDAGSGMTATPEWAVSRNGGPFRRFTPPSTTVTWSEVSGGVPHKAAVVAFRTLALDGTYRFANRVFDRAGNASRWIYGPTISPRLIQESATNIVYSAGWARVSDRSWSGLAAKESAVAGATATMRVSARAVAWIARQGEDKGEAEIRVDGALVATVSLYRVQPPRSRPLMFTKTWSTAGLHTIQITVVGTPGHPVVDIDGFLVLR